jgi:hypothetical protein
MMTVADCVEHSTRLEMVCLEPSKPRNSLSDFYSYLALLRDHWVAFMSAGPFLADRLITWFWPWARRKLDTLPHRRQIFLWLIVLGVFWSGFSAWQEEKNLRVTAEIARDAAQRHSPEMVARHLSETQKQCLTNGLRNGKNIFNNILGFVTTDENSGTYFLDYVDAFDAVYVQIIPNTTVVSSKEEHDVMIDVSDPKNPLENARKFADLLNITCQIPSHFVLWRKAPSADAFDLYIAPPR